MRVLLDTQLVLWAAAQPERLGDVRDVIESGEHELWVSTISTLEIAIKASIGKLVLPLAPEPFVASVIRRVHATTLGLTHAHASDVAALPLHHRDPFDRVLVAQARREGLPLATADRALAGYDVELLRP